ncbi:hypothetical protein T07_11639 [Trichinella nelsoni]|uniref:Uncharacterized protein n=1 Tax=Trichinella nelsoni TaxID=6336 RepID=A0A0V0RPH5_9BILA|nr:hypothetical protein T07_11639 [Trichinella nelsoni]
MVAMATCRARPFRLSYSQPPPCYLDFRLRDRHLRHSSLPSRFAFAILTHGGSYTLIHRQWFAHYEPLTCGPNQMSGMCHG